MREAIPHVAEASTFDILLDRIERLFLGGLHLGVRPSRYFDDDIQDALVLVGKERNVVKWRNDRSIVLDENAVLCRLMDKISFAIPNDEEAHTKSVGGSDETWGVFYD